MNKYEKLYREAHAAGMEAVNALEVTPMTVVDPATGQKWRVDDGVCGFAWVNVKPGNCKFANWLKKSGNGRRDSYYGGVTVWVSAFNQSMQKKEAYARAFAKVVGESGEVKSAYASSRMD